MKLIGLEEAAVLDLFPVEEIRPERGIPLKRAVEAIQAKYKFHTIPDMSLDWETLHREATYKFSGGELTVANTVKLINELSAYTDGFVVRCSHSDDAQAFLSDFYAWGGSNSRLPKAD